MRVSDVEATDAVAQEEVGGPPARRPLLRPAPAPGRSPARRPDRLAGDRLPGIAGDPADHRLLDRQPAQRPGRQDLSLENFKTLVNEPVYREIVWRTVRTALLVTVTDAVIAFPIAFYMAKVAGRRGKAVLVVAVLLPLWSSYLVKVYAWRTMLSADGVHQLGAAARSGCTARATAAPPSGW